MSDTTNKSQKDNIDSKFNMDYLKIGLLAILSFISVFGIYNTFSDYNLVSFIGNIEDTQERYANYFILILAMVTMLILQGINFKRKALGEKLLILLGLMAAIAIAITVIFVFTNSIIYPLISLLIIGISTYLLEMFFDTMGTKGLFFFMLLMSLTVIAVYKAGFHSNALLFNMAESIFAIILFLGATYPRIKSSLFKIGVRDNVDISNTGTDDSDSDQEED